MEALAHVELWKLAGGFVLLLISANLGLARVLYRLHARGDAQRDAAYRDFREEVRNGLHDIKHALDAMRAENREALKRVHGRVDATEVRLDMLEDVSREHEARLLKLEEVTTGNTRRG